ncbi:hypothetical protein MYCFIDRAFT_25275 [Lecanosticta acicola]|uniref:HhH-GPD domain-containing protein n=1 Tax=Lecanosticta acicola TaxID=111012 RepID=A0AAI8Z349_9PEZI|nr:hypothetical protein MYCFIDRAFT_25275 [Lecanosticta acicola]
MPRSTRASAARANAALTNGAEQLSSPPATPAPGKKGRTKVPKANESRMRDPPVTPASSTRKRSRKPIKQEDGDVNELPHNLGTALHTPGADTYSGPEESRPNKRQRTARKTESDGEPAIKGEDVEQPSEVKKTPKKANYGLTPGTSPYPDYPRPTDDECREVVRLLEKVHGKAIAPKAIPPPSLDVSGCGEVPSVLDALVRTRLSANTTNKNSSTAFQGLVARFGTLKEGIGKGSVDWNAVRRAPQKEVFRAIERGGLADRKSKDIQAILQMAYEENQERKAALTSDADSAAGADKEPKGEKQEEIAKATQNVISLDHIHLLSTDDAINKMLSYPGIGPKTASCVALFCLQRPSFAVDTHVFRLCQYLGWVPKTTRKGQPKVDRNTTYSHCDVRIPDDLKYPLHQLLIKHGKTCPRCRAVTGQTSANWEEGCPIEHLVKRHGAKKGGISTTDRRKAEAAAGLAGDDVDEGGADGKEVETS